MAKITGTNADEILEGTTVSDFIRGRGGDDLILGLGFNDILHGNNGNDTLLGGDRDDTLRGGSGDDWMFGQDDEDRVVFAGSGSDIAVGGVGDDDFVWSQTADGGDGQWDRIFGDDALYSDLSGAVTRRALDGDLGFDDVRMTVADLATANALVAEIAAEYDGESVAWLDAIGVSIAEVERIRIFVEGQSGAVANLDAVDFFDADAVAQFPDVFGGAATPSVPPVDSAALTVDETGDLFVSFVGSETILDNTLWVYRVGDNKSEAQALTDIENGEKQSLKALFDDVQVGDQFAFFVDNDFTNIGETDTFSEFAIGGYRGTQYLVGFEDFPGVPGTPPDFDHDDFVIAVERSETVTVDLSGESAGLIINLKEQGYNYAAKVLPIGDSITRGLIANPLDPDAFDAGFRGPLFDLLVEAGLWIDFVGAETATTPGDPSLIDDEHAGFNGRKLSQIVEEDRPDGLAQLLETHAPDVTLLYAGINDALPGFPAPGSDETPDGVEELSADINKAIDQFRAGTGLDQELVVSTLAPVTANRGQAYDAADIEFYNEGYTFFSDNPAVPVWDPFGPGSPGIRPTVSLRQVGGDNPYGDDGSNRLENLTLYENPVTEDLLANEVPGATDGVHWQAEGYELFAEGMADLLEGLGTSGGTLGDTAWKDYVGDAAVGGSGGDRLTGNDAANYLSGGAGNDLIEGCDGNDTIVAGMGDDLLSGGSGSDQFVFSLSDESPDFIQVNTITDFEVGTDWLVGVDFLLFEQIKEEDVNNDGTQDTIVSSYDFGQDVQLLGVSGITELDEIVA